MTDFCSCGWITSTPLVAHDRRSAAGCDGQRHRDVDLLEVARVLDRHHEREVGRDLHGRRRRGREVDALRRRARRDDLVAVLAARRAAGRGAVQVRVDDRERARADEVGVRDELRARHDDAGDADVLQLLRRRQAEELVPDHVARAQERRLRGQRLRRRRRVLHRGRARERVGESGEALRAQLDRVDEVLVDGAERARRADLLRLVVRLLLLLRVLLERRLELGLLQRRRDQLVRELDAEPAVVDRHRPHLVHVGRVLGLLALALAGADPRDEHDDEDDRDGDEPGEADERDDAGRGRPRRLLGTVALAASGPAGQTAARRGLLRLRLVEEVELDVVVVVGAHGAAACVGQPYPAPSSDRRISDERRVRPGRQPVGGVCRTPRLRWR